MEDLQQLVRSWFDAWAARDFGALGAMYSPEAECLRPDGYSKGREEIVAYMKQIAEAFPDETAEIRAILTCGDVATVEWTESATHTAPRRTEHFGVIEPTGKAFKNQPIADIFRFKDGEIVSQHEYYDLLSILRQLGWLELLARAAPANA